MKRPNEILTLNNRKFLISKHWPSKVLKQKKHTHTHIRIKFVFCLLLLLLLLFFFTVQRDMIYCEDVFTQLDFANLQTCRQNANARAVDAGDRRLPITRVRTRAMLRRAVLVFLRSYGATLAVRTLLTLFQRALMAVRARKASLVRR